MLVEDDNSLREIYQARLMAEGYQIVAAKDGEEALALVATEKPDLIILDIMMPKISGFDTLDILKSTPATSNTKVIMMSALSQAEDKTRAEKLGANKYLVKSQVTLEDIVKAVKEVMEADDAAQPVNLGSAPVPSAGQTPPPSGQFFQNTTVPAPPQPEPQPTVDANPSVSPSLEQAEAAVSQQSSSIAQEQSVVNQQTSNFADTGSEMPEPTSPDSPIVPPPVVENTMPPSVTDLPSTDDSDVTSDPNPLNNQPFTTDNSSPSEPPATQPVSEDSAAQPTVAISGTDTIAAPRSSAPAETTVPPPSPAPTPPVVSESTPEPVNNAPQTVGGTKVIEPLNSDVNPKSRLDDLLAAEEAKEHGLQPRSESNPQDSSQPPQAA